MRPPLRLRTVLRVSPQNLGATSDVDRGGPDALLVDLSGPVVPDARLVDLVASWAARPARPHLILGLSPLSAGRADAEIAAALPARPDAVWLAGAMGLRDVEHLGAKLAVAEAEHGLPPGSLAILAEMSGTAGALLASSTVHLASAGRLAALVYDPDRLGRALGCDGDGPALATARGLIILAAAAAGVPALLVSPGGSEFARGRRDGFAGAMVTSGAEVVAAREAFVTALRPASDA